jgi:hypothetical protein
VSVDQEPFLEPDNSSLVDICPDLERQELEEASYFSRLGAYAFPVILAHLALLYVLAKAIFRIRLPDFLHSNLIVTWLLINGALVALGIWLWRKGRIPVAKGRWLTGRHARWSIVIWLGSSLALFLLPAVTGDIWETLLARFAPW